MSSAAMRTRTVWFLLSNSVNAGISFLTVIYLARLLDTASFGRIALYTTISLIAAPLISLSLEGSLAINKFKMNELELGRHIGSCLAIIFAITFVAILVQFPLQDLISDQLSISGSLIGIALLTATAQAVINIKLSLFTVKGEATKYAMLQVSSAVAASGLTFALLAWTTLGWEARPIALLVSSLVVATLVLSLLKKTDHVEFRPNWVDSKLGLRFGLPLVPHSFGALFFTSFDKILVNHLLGVQAVGIYQFGGQIGSIALLLTDAINKAFAPWLYAHLQNRDPNNDKRLVKVTYIYFLSALAVGVIIFLLPFNIASMIGGSAYLAADRLVPVFIAGHCFGGMYFMVVNYLFFAGKTIHIAAATIAAGSLSLLIAFYMTLHFGLVGAAMAFLAGKAIHFMIVWHMSMKAFPLPWFSRYSTVKVR